jgi:hypothetical protein
LEFSRVLKWLELHMPRGEPVGCMGSGQPGG